MKQVGVREFRDRATAYLSGSEPIAVTKYGRNIGIYIPLERNENELRRAVDQVEQILNRILAETTGDEDELRAGLQLARIRLQAESR